MGKHNSSVTRVVPVFARLWRRDPTGAQWLDQLLRLPVGLSRSVAIPSGLRLVEAHPETWGDQEVSLPAPRELLLHLVRTVTPARVEAVGVRSGADAKRLGMAAGDEQLLQEALVTLRSGHRGRSWCVLEGPSRPDALLETNTHLICVEGKRTERACTTKTTWMPVRSRLLRHMDAAMDCFPGKTILGMLVVEGDGGSEAIVPSQWWIEQLQLQTSSDMVTASLPHRNAAQQHSLAAGIMGVTTWQAICSTFDLGWPPNGSQPL